MSKTVGVILALKDKCSPQINKIAERLGVTEKEAKRVDMRINKLSKNLGNGLKNASRACAVGIGALTGTIGVATNATISYEKEVKQMQRLTGASIEEASKMVVVGKRYGVSADMMAKSIRMLGIKATNGSKDFKKYGLVVKDSHGQLLPASKILENVADKYKQLGGGLKGAVFAQKIMGKSAMQMIPLLEKGSAGVRDMYQQAERMGLVLTNDNMTAFGKFAKAQKDFNQAMLGIQVSIGTKALPMLSLLAEKAQIVTQKINFKQIGNETINIFKTMGNVFKFCSNHMALVTFATTALVGTMATFKTAMMITGAINAVTVAIEALKVAQLAWNIQLTGTKILMGSLGIGLVIGGISALAMNWDKVTKATKKAFDITKKFVALTPAGMMINAGRGIAQKVQHHYATGTSYSSGGPSLVGEFGPEIVNLKRGTRISSNRQSEKQINQRPITFNQTVNIQGNVLGNKQFFNHLSREMGFRLQQELMHV